MPSNEDQAQVIGKRIRERRDELGLSRFDLAAMIRTREGNPQSYSKIAQWEQGKSVPTADRRPELADALQTTTVALFGEGTDEPGTLKRLDLVERQVTAIIRLQGLGDAVESALRSERQAERRKAQADAARRKGKLAAVRTPRAQKGKARGRGK